MREIPIAALPSQSFNVNLGTQPCKIKIYQKTNGVYLDLLVLNRPIVQAAICLDRVRLVRHEYLGFIGNLSFVDTQGQEPPDYTGFGARFRLVYEP